ncbi:hypothetical protein CY34DRAFT_454315 [Suillus luteus UH-Slu-Lm8-n1]|uniref:Uncharacterized protein n=1 Tax=Suillus luteus UH-Slu-Lm8-n1 TaxID=930992 RepID=A0A0C9ZJB4_9AGAM|nr:hypothetical protein CY34DRAFT_454315 [Suillus luteus UH-Slu-Lm8-n1]
MVDDTARREFRQNLSAPASCKLSKCIILSMVASWKNRSAHHLHLSPVIEVLVWCCLSLDYSALRARTSLPLATGMISSMPVIHV